MAEDEGDAIDRITNSMFSLDFLREISDLIFSSERNALTVGQFYDQWRRKASPNEIKIPFSLGIVLGQLYVAIVWGKEHWFDIIPDSNAADVDSDWGLAQARFQPDPNPTLRNAVRRMRNALAHGNARFVIPQGVGRENMLAETHVELHDRHPDNPADIFQVTISLLDAFRFVKKFQSVIHRHVRER